MRLDREIGESRPIEFGLSRGSPVSPKLFMLYIAPIFRLEGFGRAFEYADDVSLLEISPTLEENSTKLSSSINCALNWGDTEGVTFEPAKSELPHLSRKIRDKGRSPQVQTSHFTIAENPQKPYLKWLGLHFDKKLSFKTHVQIQSTKALKVAKALRCLENTTRGASPHLSRQAIIACALPIAYCYGLAVRLAYAVAYLSYYVNYVNGENMALSPICVKGALGSTPI